jgi:hypothetical protein
VANARVEKRKAPTPVGQRREARRASARKEIILAESLE